MRRYFTNWVGDENWGEAPVNPETELSWSGSKMPEAERRSRMEPGANAQAWNISVLLVEDDAADTNLILDVLKRNASVCSAAATDRPELALRELAAGRSRPDLILLDIHMPRLNGFEFLGALRQIPAMAETPVVFLTTSGLGRDVTEAVHSSAVLYIVKPNTYAELQSRLDGVVKRATSGAWRK